MLVCASALILLVASGKMRWRVARLAAAGRMALTNYLASSIVFTTIFYGYGGGWFGAFSRAALVPFVLAMWGLTLAWAAPWPHPFSHGPVEWLWRSLARPACHPQRISPTPTRKPAKPPTKLQHPTPQHQTTRTRKRPH